MDSIYCITESSGSLTRNMSEQILINHFKAMSRYNDFLQKNNEFEYQAPMLGWVLKASKLSYALSIKLLWKCIKHGYPLKPMFYLKNLILS